MPAVLRLDLNPTVSFGGFVPGVARDYAASVAGTVTSTAGDATLAVADSTGDRPGHLVNGSFMLPQPLLVQDASGVFAVLPATVKSYSGPVSNDPVTVNFKQSIGVTDAAAHRQLREDADAQPLHYAAVTISHAGGNQAVKSCGRAASHAASSSRADEAPFDDLVGVRAPARRSPR